MYTFLFAHFILLIYHVWNFHVHEANKYHAETVVAPAYYPTSQAFS